MTEQTENTRSLRLVHGNLLQGIWIGPVLILAAPEGAPPFHIDALAKEEDTFLVLSADKQIREPTQPLMRIMTRLIETPPKVPGTVVLRNEQPLKILAIIHDFNQEPSCREEWIAQALDGLFYKSESLGFRSLGLPLLGTIHGALDKERSIKLIAEALKKRDFNHLRRLWLVVQQEMAREVFNLLRAELLPKKAD